MRKRENVGYPKGTAVPPEVIAKRLATFAKNKAEGKKRKISTLTGVPIRALRLED